MHLYMIIRTGQTNEFDVALLVILSNAREAIITLGGSTNNNKTGSRKWVTGGKRNFLQKFQ